MKLEALGKAIATAHQQTRILENKAQQSGRAARAAKDKARQAKSRLKLARQEAKQARKAAKDAKRAFAEAFRAGEKAAAEVTRLEKKLQKTRKKASQAYAKNGKPKQAPAHKPAAAKPRSAAPKSVAANSSAKPAAPAKPLRGHNRKAVQPASSALKSNIQVPRDIAPTPASVPTANPSKRATSALPGADTSS
jgi:colicin import membrane protein